MNATFSLSSIATTTISNNDDVNGSLADDWENYKAYTRFYHITDEVFLYANPILIFIGKLIVFFILIKK
jgi:hypothetical protein